MKPRSKLEKTVAALSEKLPPLNENQIMWIKRNAIPAVAYRSNKNTWCTACCKDFPSDEKHKRCPHCGARFSKIEDSPRKFKCKESYYTTIHTTFVGFQVARHFLVSRLSLKYKEPVWSINEVVQIWINDKGEDTIMARNVLMHPWYNDMWNFRTPLSIKHRPNYYSYRQDRYDISSYSNRMCRVLPVIRRNGFDGRFHDITPTALFKLILSSPQAELLIKTNQYSLLKYYADNGDIKYPHAVNICNRNGYIVKDASMWIDHVQLLDELGYDTHNAFYVCPNDLLQEHQKMLKIKRKKEDKEKFEKNILKAKKCQRAYRKSKGKYFGIVFGNDKITISVIRSVSDMLEEGIVLHHCVFDMGYYKKKESLILSAKDKDGKRLETIEYNLRTKKLMQCRGLMNKPTAFHDEIVSLFNNNIRKFIA